MKRLVSVVIAAVMVAVGVGVAWIVTSTPARRVQASSGRNVLIIMTDDQNVDSLPVMRNLMAYPGGAWVNFTHAFANDSICCPARSTLLTGQYSHHHGVLSNATRYTAKLNANNTLATWLDAAGYRTGVIGKYLNGITGKQPGWDVWQVGKGNADKQTAQALTFLRESTGPFFLWLSYTAPHTKAHPPDRYKTVAAYMPPDAPNYLEQDVSDKPLWVRQLPIPSGSKLNEWRLERLNSQRELLAVDDGVQAVIDALQASGQLDNTLVIFLGDQGFSWGSHRWFYKHCAYDECSQFPLLIRYPGAVNHDEARLVSNVSLASTIAEWAGVTPGRPQDAGSLIPLLDGTATEWNEVLLIQKRAGNPSNGAFWGIRAPGWMYAEYDNGDRELYDMDADPWQLENVVNRAEYEAVRLHWAATLAAMK